MKEYKAAVAALLGERTDTEAAQLAGMAVAQVKKVRLAEGGDLLDAIMLVAGLAPSRSTIRFGLVGSPFHEGDSIKRSLGESIRARRRRLGKTQTDVAAAVGCNTSWLCQIELGNTNPRLTTLVRIAAALDAELGLSY